MRSASIAIALTAALATGGCAPRRYVAVRPPRFETGVPAQALFPGLVQYAAQIGYQVYAANPAAGVFQVYSRLLGSPPRRRRPMPAGSIMRSDLLMVQVVGDQVRVSAIGRHVRPDGTMHPVLAQEVGIFAESLNGAARALAQRVTDGPTPEPPTGYGGLGTPGAGPGRGPAVGGAVMMPGAMQPQPGAMQPQPGAMQPQPGAMQPQPGAMQPQPGAMQPQPGATQPQPGAMQPQPGAMQPQPGATQPQPGATQPQPGATQPQPGATQPQPGATQPQPGAMQPQPGAPPGPPPGSSTAPRPGDAPEPPAQPGSQPSAPPSPPSTLSPAQRLGRP